MGLFDRLKEVFRGSPSLSTSEAPIAVSMRDNIRNCAVDCIKELGLDEAASPEDLVGAVNEHIVALQQSADPPPKSPFEHLPLVLGALWGEQLVEKLKWEWVEMTFHLHGDCKAVGVVSPDRSLMICPFHYVFGCMANDVTSAVALSFNMLVDGSGIPPIPPGSYENVMDSVRHIIPPD